MRTLIYARFSSHLQNSRSIEDQIAVCTERCAREGWTVVEVFTDYAISGAAGIAEAQRPGLNALLARAEAGGIDQVMAEATDRFARHQGDSFAIRERLEYAGVRLFTLSDGQVDEITGTIKGLFDAKFRRELASKVKRGQRGTVKDGRSPAGLAYGYRKANRLDGNGDLVRGLREIDDDQAEIVRRIFREYAANQSVRTIAERLNAEGVLGPRGQGWRLSTISGDRKRGNGMLQNRLYVGELVHERTSKVTDPRSRKTRIRPNDPATWQVREVPELRIVDQDLWTKVQERRASHSGMRPELSRRPKRLLSGLVVCGSCGDTWTVIGRERWGCARRRDGSGCTNNRSITTDLFEGRVLTGLREQMLDPELVRVFVTEYHREYARRIGTLSADRARIERRQAEATAKVERLVIAIANGADEFVEIRAVLAKARAERDALAAELSQLEALPVIALHPRIADDYRRQVERLSEVIAGDDKARLEVIPILRSLIDRVTVHPNLDKQRGVLIEVTGQLASIIALASGKPVEVAMYGNGGAGSGNRTRV